MILEYIKYAMLILLILFGVLVVSLMPRGATFETKGLNLDDAKVEAFVNGFKGGH